MFRSCVISKYEVSKPRAAGGLFYAEDTGRVLVQKRSAEVNEPNVWGTWGGGIEKHESIEEGLKRELYEEAGFNREAKYIPVKTFENAHIIFYSFLIVVPKEFEPVLSWESSDWVWTTLDNMPRPLHFGLEELLPHYLALDYE